MDIRAKLIEVQKSRKRRLPINDSSELSDVQLPEKNLEENNEENLEANLIKFEQGVTNKGNVALWHVGYRYVKNDKNSNYWRCSNKDCPAKTKAIQKGGQFIGTLGKKEHNHPPAIQKKTAEEIRNKLKREARGNILAEVRANIPDEVYISLGTDCALKQLMSRQKNRMYGNVNCTDLSKLVIPESLTHKYGSSTLIYDSRTKRGYEDVVLVFSHLRLLDILSENRQWAIDGTFSSAPKPFVQCLCIGAFVHGRIVVCVQALLPSKRSVHYEETLEAIKRAISPIEPKRVISDFEKAEIAALQTTFPAAHLSGCLFHFGQSLWRKWRDLGLDRLFGDKTNEGERARNSFRRLLLGAYSTSTREAWFWFGYKLLSSKHLDISCLFFVYIHWFE